MLLTGCGTSPQEKRNNFDACVIEEAQIFRTKISKVELDPKVYEIFEKQIPIMVNNKCVKFLK